MGYPLAGARYHPCPPPPQPGMGYPPPPGYDNRWSTCYAAAGMPLMFTQEDFLVFITCACVLHFTLFHTVQCYVIVIRILICDITDRCRKIILVINMTVDRKEFRENCTRIKLLGFNCVANSTKYMQSDLSSTLRSLLQQHQRCREDPGFFFGRGARRLEGQKFPKTA